MEPNDFLFFFKLGPKNLFSDNGFNYQKIRLEKFIETSGTVVQKSVINPGVVLNWVDQNWSKINLKWSKIDQLSKI